MHDLHGIFRDPLLPLPSKWVAGLKSEPPVFGESGTNRSKRFSQLFVFDKHLECVTGHYDEVKLPTPVDRTHVTKYPLRVGAFPPRLLEHRL